MAREVINVGSAPNDGTGDPLRTAYIKCNNNFGELYSRIQFNAPLTLVGSPGDLAGTIAVTPNFLYYCFQDYDGSSVIWAQLADVQPTTLTNGTSQLDVLPSGNINFSVANIANVLVVGSSGIFTGNIDISDELNVFGNVTMGNLLPWGNAAYDLGAANLAWRDLYLSGNSLYLGSAQITANASSITFLTGDGTEFVVAGSGGGGNAVGNFASVTVTGNVVSGNVTTTTDVVAAGNVLGSYIIGDGSYLTNVTAAANVAVTQVANGTSVLSVQGPGAPVLVQVGGVSNVAVFSTTGLAVTGAISTTGTVSVGNLTTAGSIAGANLAVTGAISADSLGITGLANLTSVTPSTNTTTGALVTAGGMGIGGNAYIGQNIVATGNIVAGNLAISGSVSAGAISAASLNASGNVTGGNLTTTGVILTTGSLLGANLTITNFANIQATTDSGNTTTGALVIAGGMGVAKDFNLGGNAAISQALSVLTDTTIGGTLAVTGNVSAGNVSAASVSLASITKLGANGAGNIGSSTNSFNTIFARSTSALYADLAENYLADDDYVPGTVVSLGGAAEVTQCKLDQDPAVVGIVSSNPAMVMNAGLKGEHPISVALLGRVPCRVQGPVRRGQLMVGTTDGCARAEDSPVMGAVLGKALQSFDGSVGIIEILVGRI